MGKNKSKKKSKDKRRSKSRSRSCSPIRGRFSRRRGDVENYNDYYYDYYTPESFYNRYYDSQGGSSNNQQYYSQFPPDPPPPAQDATVVFNRESVDVPPLPLGPPPVRPPLPKDPETKENDNSENEDGDSDVVKDTSSSLNFKDKLNLVGVLLADKMNVSEEVKEVTFFSSKPVNALLKLPMVSDFDVFLEQFKTDLAEKEKKNTATGGSGVGSLVTWKNPMRNYKVADPKWNPEAVIYNQELLGSSIFPAKQAPKVSCDQAKFAKFEGSAKELISMANNSDWFIQASMEGIARVQESLSNPPEDKDGLSILWNQLEDVKELLQSAGKGQEDIAKQSIYLANNLVLTRRDSWLDAAPKQVKPDLLKQLRYTDLQGAKLFDEGILSSVLESADRHKATNRQDRLVTGIWQLKKQMEVKPGFKFDRQRPGNKFEPFRKTFQEKQNQFQKQGFSSQGRGRGRGGGKPPMPFDRNIQKSFDKDKPKDN